MKRQNLKLLFNKILAIVLVLLNIISIPFGATKVYADEIDTADGTIELDTIEEEVAEEEKEFNAVWISYLEFNDRLKDPETGVPGFTKERFETVINEMFDQVVSLNMNAVIVHVRPFGDAFYPSKYFPWSKYISGTQGVDPGFDPLDFMVRAAHERGLEFHAWINPYRVTKGTTDVKTLAKNNKARKWMTSESEDVKRRVLSYAGSLYYNPANTTVQSLIRNGVKEIVENYDVDGIHFDDYFYPTLGNNYATNFDYLEYEAYVAKTEAEGKKVLSIQNWRRNNVNKLIKKVYNAVKAAGEDKVFGISPGGFLDYLLMDDRYYCDVKTWLSKSGYVDYLAPQLYWSFSHSKFPYDKILERWIELHKNKDVKLYVGIAVYKAGSNEDSEWKSDTKILKKQIEYARKTGDVSGFLYFRHDFFFKKATKKGVQNLLKVIPKAM